MVCRGSGGKNYGSGRCDLSRSPKRSSGETLSGGSSRSYLSRGNGVAVRACIFEHLGHSADELTHDDMLNLADEHGELPDPERIRAAIELRRETQRFRTRLQEAYDRLAPLDDISRDWPTSTRQQGKKGDRERQDH